MNQQLAAAQQELQRKRQANGQAPQPIKDVMPAAIKATPDPVEVPPARRPERVRLETLDLRRHAKVANAVNMARAWAERKRAGHSDASIILVGPNGVGKTHIARAIWWSMTQAAIDEDGRPIPGTAQPSGLFFASNDLVSLMGQTRDADTGLVSPVRASAVIGNAPLVVIDDVGAEQAIPFVAAVDQEAERHSRLFKLVDYCYTMHISLVVTSNLTLSELATHLGRRSWDRLAQMAPKLADGRSLMVDMTGVPSYRLQASGR